MAAMGNPLIIRLARSNLLDFLQTTPDQETAKEETDVR
jgi:hypothetical protein